MNTNIITSEDKITYERLHNAIRNERKEKFIDAIINIFYDGLQKVIGTVFIITSIIACMYIGDLTALAVTIPIGLYFTFTRENLFFEEE